MGVHTLECGNSVDGVKGGISRGQGKPPLKGPSALYVHPNIKLDSCSHIRQLPAIN